MSNKTLLNDEDGDVFAVIFASKSKIISLGKKWFLKEYTHKILMSKGTSYEYIWRLKSISQSIKNFISNFNRNEKQFYGRSITIEDLVPITLLDFDLIYLCNGKFLSFLKENKIQVFRKNEFELI